MSGITLWKSFNVGIKNSVVKLIHDIVKQFDTGSAVEYTVEYS